MLVVEWGTVAAQLGPGAVFKRIISAQTGRWECRYRPENSASGLGCLGS